MTEKTISAVAAVSFLLLCSVYYALPAEASYVPGWGVAELIETDDSDDALYPSLAVDDEGNAVAVWEQSDGARKNIWANRYAAGVGWGVPCRIEFEDLGDALRPDVGMDGAGNAVAIWRQSNGVVHDVYANRYVAGVGWGSPVKIEANDAGSASECDLAVDRDGNAVAVWNQWETRWNIWANTYVVGEGWGEAQLLESDDTGDASDPKVAVDGSGGAIAVWSQSDGSFRSIWSSTYSSDEGWADPVLVEMEDLGDAHEPSVAFDSHGNALAVWHQLDGTRFNIMANRYDAETGWGSPTQIDDNEVTDSVRAVLAITPDGDAAAVWYQSKLSVTDVWACSYFSGEGWQTPVMLDDDDSGSAYYPKVAVDSAGNALAVWYQSDGSRYNIMSSRLTRGSVWEDPVPVEAQNAGNAFEPVVAMNDGGVAFSVWYQSDSVTYSIWSNRHVWPDETPPRLEVFSPSDGDVVDEPVVSVSGMTDPGASVDVNGVQATVASDGSFSLAVSLLDESSTVTVTATDEAGNSVSVSRSVTYVDPAIALEEKVEDLETELADVKDELAAAGSEIDDLTQALDTVTSELGEARDEMVMLEDDIDGLREELSDAQSQGMLLVGAVVALLIVVLLLLAMLLRKGRGPMRLSGRTEEASRSRSASSAVQRGPSPEEERPPPEELASGLQKAPEGAPSEKRGKAKTK